jgi:hypothetical protein
VFYPTPSFRHFGPVIRGFLRIGDVESATRVLLRRLDACTKDSKPWEKPNSMTIGLVVQAWIRFDLLRATLLLYQIEELHDTKPLPDGPNAQIYTALLALWSRSANPEKLMHMERLSKKIDIEKVEAIANE